MALSRKQKAGIGVGVGALLLLGFAGVANADDLPDVFPDNPPPPPPDDNPDPAPGDLVICPPGQIRLGGQCIVPPPPPDPKKCNYLGCGPAFDTPQQQQGNTATSVAFRLQQLQYPINPAQANFTLISAYAMSVVREFQRDYNAVVAGKGVATINSKIAADGLTGVNTIGSIKRAQAAVIQLNLPWVSIVALA